MHSSTIPKRLPLTLCTIRKSQPFLKTQRAATSLLNTPRTPYKPPGRAYHSHVYEQSPPFSPTETAILSAALSHVPTHGFSDTALYNGARDAGYIDTSLNLFPRGVFDLIVYHLTTQRLALKNAVQFPEDKQLGVGRKVRSLVLHRLRANQDIVHKWQQVSQIFFFPPLVSIFKLPIRWQPLCISSAYLSSRDCRSAYNVAAFSLHTVHRKELTAS
jgi:hypothetical protein